MGTEEEKSSCGLWIKKGFNNELKAKKHFDFSQFFKTIKNTNSKVGRRFGRFVYQKHKSNRYLKNEIQLKVDERKLGLNITDSANQNQILYAKEVKFL